MKRPLVRLTVLSACLLNIGACAATALVPVLENKQALAFASAEGHLSSVDGLLKRASDKYNK